MIVQIWCVIKELPEQLDDDGNIIQDPSNEDMDILRGLGADQYYEVGQSHDGLRLLHCLMDTDIIPVIQDYISSRGQEPEIVAVTNQDGSVRNEFPLNQELLDSFFPDGTIQHQFAGWVL